MSERIRRFGLIGYPLSHSFSPGYFAAKFEREGIEGCRYDAFPLASLADFTNLLADMPELVGLNVTIPYKSAIIPFLDGLSREAAAIGAVNVIKIADGKLTGHNSDAYGFSQSLRSFLQMESRTELQALVLGTGGASKAVQFALQEMGIPFQLVSRQKQAGILAYEDIDVGTMKANRLIVNTTPMGMTPDISSCPPIPYEHLTSQHFCFDLVYNPSQTRFMAMAAVRGAHTLNGLEMLHLQAERAWEIWNAVD